MPVSKRTANADLQTGVYCWHNRINGKVYVGSAAQSFKRRKCEHLCALRRGTSIHQHLQHAWNKYGEDTFDWVVLERCLPEECIKREQYWIDERRAVDPEYGYNSCPTAGSCLGRKHSGESKAKASATMKEACASPEVRKRMSEENNKRYTNPDFRKRLSAAMKEAYADPEARKRMSATAKKVYTDPEVRKRMADPEFRKRMSSQAKKAAAERNALAMEERLLGLRSVRRQHRRK